jgi:hypothetical protein
LNVTNGDFELALNSYFLNELKFSEKEAKEAYVEIKAIESNLSQ